MRRQFMMLTAILAAAGLAACGPKAGESTKEPVSVEGTADYTTGETEGETPDITGEADESGEAKESGGTDESSGAGGNGGHSDAGGALQASDQTLVEIHEAVMKAYGERYIPSMPYYDTDMEEMFGVKKDWYDEFIAEGPMISVHVETFIAVKAKPGKASEVKKALETFRTNQIETSMQYPMNMPKLEASQVLEHGDYVFFVMLGSASQDAESEDAALESAKQDNQIAVDVIENYFKENQPA